MGRCRVRAICVWVSAPVAAWWLVLAPAGTVLVSPGLHFESFVSLWGDPETQRVRHIEKLLTNTKIETTWELNWEPFGTHLETVAS